MKNFRLIVQNISDSATLTAIGSTTFPATLPLTNIQKYNNSRVARFTHPSESIFKGVFDSPQVINCVVLWRHTLSSSATWRVQIYSGNNLDGDLLFDNGDGAVILPKTLDELDWGIDPLNPDSFSGFGKLFAHIWTGDLLAGSFSITIKDPVSASFDIARLYMGRYFDTVVNASYGLKNSWVDNSRQARTAGGGMWVDAVEKYRKISFGVDQMSSKERATMFEAFNYCGKQKDVFITMFPEIGGIVERDYSFAAKFVSSPDFDLHSYNSFSAPFELEEV